ncbi:MAG: hypothetical protein M5U12_36845 [Verrucomicrobia bacterium]|nr:hypothetical protein [Verrucomicrobiota bacterium]
MLDPGSGARVGGGFEPGVGAKDVGAPVAVEVADAAAEVHELFRDDMLDERARAVGLGDGFEPEGGLGGGQDLAGLAVAIDVHEFAAFEVDAGLGDGLGPLAAAVAGIAIPPDALAEPAARDHVDEAVAVHVEGQVHEVVEVAFAILVHLADQGADLDGAPVGRQVEVGASNDIEASVAVEVRDLDRLAAHVTEAVGDERYRRRGIGGGGFGAEGDPGEGGDGGGADAELCAHDMNWKLRGSVDRASADARTGWWWRSGVSLVTSTPTRGGR